MTLAERIARDIFMAGSGPRKTTRIQFMAQKADQEVSQGGFCERALAQCIQESLDREIMGKDTK